MSNVFGKVQKLGKALMTPVAILPVAALFLRLGAGIPGIEGQLAQYFLKSGAAVFDNMALLFAIGIAFGLAKDNHGAAALAGAVGFLVMENVYLVANADINTGVFGGIIMGIIAGNLYNKYYNIELPDFLGFFGGKRFVPIVTGFAAVAVGILFGFIWPVIQNGLDIFSHTVVEAGALGTFAFGFGNRLLIPIGLHHVLNSVFWFGHGAFTNAAGEVINGDLLRFLAGDPTAGAFQAGFYPIMMFGLPAGALAMYTAARKENKKMVAGLLTSVAFTSFLTGITEPIEFMFVFIAPVLYFIHALLTGIAMAITSSLGILHGFGFSAGAFDFFINMNKATNGWLLVPIGLAFGAIYYFAFLFAIKKFDLPTPGREEDAGESTNEIIAKEGISGLARDYVKALGGKDNLIDIDACITRLRLTVKDQSIIKEEDLKALGASGVLKPNKKNMQVIVGTKAEIIAGEMKRL